jgi:hypothetical protein
MPPVSLRAVCTWRDAARVFAAQPSPRVMSAALAGLVVRRALDRRAGPADLATATVVLATRGLHEYAIHRWLLHAPRRTAGGVAVDPGAGHRAHHADPDDPRPAFLPPVRAVVFLALLAVYVTAAGRLLRLAPSTRRTAVVAAWAALLAYEWQHFVDHTSVPLRSRRLRTLRTHHRAHHFADDGRDLGITSRAGDLVAERLGMHPRPSLGEPPGTQPACAAEARPKGRLSRRSGGPARR